MNNPKALRELAAWWAAQAANEPSHPLTAMRLGLATHFDDLARNLETGVVVITLRAAA